MSEAASQNCLNLRKRGTRVRQHPNATDQVTNQTREEVDQMAKSYIAHIGQIFQDLFKRRASHTGPPGVCFF